MENKKLIAFDLYDTCIHYPKKKSDSEEILKQIWEKYQYYKELKKILQLKPVSIDEANNILWNELSENTITLLKKSVQKDIEQVLLYPDFLPTIEKLKNSGYKTAVVSNLSKDYEIPLRTKIPQWTFDYEALSFDVWAMKPDPEIFGHLKKISWVDFSDMVMVWDLVNLDVKWAQNVWITPILINRSDKLKNHNDKDYTIIHTLSQLCDILL